MSDRIDGGDGDFRPELYRERYSGGVTFEEYLEEVRKYPELWRSVYERAELPAAVREEAGSLSGRWHLLALSEDWCGDAVNSLGWVARLAESSEALELRVISRDENPEIMDAHLWDGRARAIPVVILLDEDFEEVGWWGPRPSSLQGWVLGEGQKLDSRERYREVRRWYARDRGRTIVREILEMIQSGEVERRGALAGRGG